ncbi:MAG: hypothetical protein AB7N91_32025 [Candidatus Tectimicrobiota bacterium]
MQARSWRWLMLLLVVVSLVGCSSDDDDEDIAQVSGNYQGTIQDSIAGPGTLRVSIIQQGNQLSGSWQSSFNNAANDNSGTLSGTAGEDDAQVIFTPARVTACPFQTTLDVNDSRLQGTYAAFNCTTTLTGTLSVTRQ